MHNNWMQRCNFVNTKLAQIKYIIVQDGGCKFHKRWHKICSSLPWEKRHCEWNYYWISGKFIWTQSYFHLYHILRYPSSHIRARSKGQSSNGAYLKTIAFIKGSDWLLIYLRISFVEGSDWNSQYGVRKRISSFFQQHFFIWGFVILGLFFFYFPLFSGQSNIPRIWRMM